MFAMFSLVMILKRISARFQYTWQIWVCLFLVVVSTTFTGCGSPSSESVKRASVRLELSEAGQASQAFLRASPYSELVIEIAAVSGYEPTAEVLGELKSFLEKHLNKPNGIKIVTGAVIPATGSSGLSLEQIDQLEMKYRKKFSAGTTLAAFIMILDNHYTSGNANSGTLAVAFRSTSIAVFKEHVTVHSSGLPDGLLEATVLAHEFGHLFGLVNAGAPVASGFHNESTVSPHHCNNSACLMYSDLDSTKILEQLVDGKIPSFDDACATALREAGAKEF